jgi:hypothetical protein
MLMALVPEVFVRLLSRLIVERRATGMGRIGWLSSLPRYQERLLGLSVKTHLLPQRAGPQDPRVT